MSIDPYDRKYKAPEFDAPATEKQVGGSHYTRFAIQPVDFIHRNNLGFLVGAVIKYVCRYPFKNGKQDLDKAIHCLELLRELEYGDTNDNRKL